MGNTEVMWREDLQMTSAGTGIRRSEKCHGPKQVYFLQIWASPNESNLTPKYYTRFAFYSPQSFLLGHRFDQAPHLGTIRHFSDEDKENK
jgi:redox-sensitive bicupin YhaK (pirin superfamily)